MEAGESEFQKPFEWQRRGMKEKTEEVQEQTDVSYGRERRKRHQKRNRREKTVGNKSTIVHKTAASRTPNEHQIICTFLHVPSPVIFS